MTSSRSEALREAMDEAVATLIAVDEPLPPEVVWEMLEPDVRRAEFLAALRSDRRVRLTDEGWVEFRPGARVAASSDRPKVSAVDVIVDALEASGEPMTFDRIHAAAGTDYSEESLKSRLSADPRIIRTDREAFGLAEWGLEPYDGLVNMMKRSIERQGGTAAIDDIISDLAKRFTFKERSVRTFARTDEFISAGRGRIRVREQHERPEEQEAPTSASRGCVIIDHRWALRVTIDERLLSGYSVDLPQGFGRALGVARGEYARIDTDNGAKLGVSRRVMNDSLGRLRPVAESLGLEPGDVLFVIAPRTKREQVSFRAIEFEELAEMEDADRVAALLGIEGEVDAPTVARALGMPARSSVMALVTTLRNRGEPDLADDLASVLLDGDDVGGVDAADIAEALGF